MKNVLASIELQDVIMNGVSLAWFLLWLLPWMKIGFGEPPIYIRIIGLIWAAYTGSVWAQYLEWWFDAREIKNEIIRQETDYFIGRHQKR